MEGKNKVCISAVYPRRKDADLVYNPGLKGQSMHSRFYLPGDVNPTNTPTPLQPWSVLQYIIAAQSSLVIILCFFIVMKATVVYLREVH